MTLYTCSGCRCVRDLDVLVISSEEPRVDDRGVIVSPLKPLAVLRKCPVCKKKTHHRLTQIGRLPA